MVLDIRNRHGERLDHALAPADHLPGSVPLVVIGHGVTANKDRAWAVALADALTKRGFWSLRLSFSGNGSSEGDFRESTISKEVEDLGSVLDAVGDRGIAYVGHSMGAAVGVIAASRDPRIRWLVSLAGMVHTADFAARKFGNLQPDVDVMWDKPECPLSSTFLADMNEIASVDELGAAIEDPWLLVHGTADEVVPVRDAKDIVALSDCAELVTMEGVDHVFSGHAAQDMAEIVTDWLAARIR